MLDSIRLLEPVYLWLLVVPALLLGVWAWQLVRRRVEVRRFSRDRTIPVPERYPYAGELSFWLALIGALALVVVALTRPQLRVNLVQRAGLDIIVLLDGSTSMRVTDVAPDRWQRSTAWLRTFAETLSWTDERVALALFAYRPAPQVRLTSDPNAFFFFLDHLQTEPPFRLADEASWDTNIQEGLFWGVRMLDLDEQLYGRRRSAKAFIIVSDGQDWSDEVEASVTLARARGARIYVVGVGTTAGGLIPDLPPQPYQQRPAPIHSTLDRRALRAIADAGGGTYFELGTSRDDVIALEILTDLQERTQTFQREEVFADLYWWLLAGAAGLVTLGTLVVRQRARLWWQLVVGIGVLVLLT